VRCRIVSKFPYSHVSPGAASYYDAIAAILGVLIDGAATEACGVSGERTPPVPNRGAITATIISACIMQGVDQTIYVGKKKKKEGKKRKK